MSTSGGQIPDIRGSSYHINGKLVIDKDTNIKCKNLTCKTFNVTGNVSYDTVLACKLQENTAGESVLIDKPLIQNPHGIGRIYLDNFVKIDNNDTPVMLYGNAFVKSFESYGNGPDLLILPSEPTGPIFTAPNSYSNNCLDSNWQLMVEVDISITLDAVTAGNENKFVIRLKKNDTIVSEVRKTLSLYFVTNDNISLHDVILFSPNDQLYLEVEKQANDGSVALINGSQYSWATFKVLGFYNNTLV